MKHITITVKGIVQGVFFRAFTQKEAQRLNINGFVRNEPTGEVYIEAEGDENALNELIKWCRTGSPHSVVKDVKTGDGRMKHFKEFIISR